MPDLDIGKQVGELRQEVAGLKAELTSMVNALKDMGTETGREALSRARETGEMVRGRAVDLQEQTGHYIEQRPLTSVLVAFGTGLALGTLIGARTYH